MKLMGFVNFWRDVGESPGEFLKPVALWQGLRDALSMKNLHGAGAERATDRQRGLGAALLPGERAATARAACGQREPARRGPVPECIGIRRRRRGRDRCDRAAAARGCQHEPGGPPAHGT